MEGLSRPGAAGPYVDHVLGQMFKYIRYVIILQNIKPLFKLWFNMWFNLLLFSQHLIQPIREDEH